MIGFKAPAIPLLSDIEIKKLAVYYAPDGMAIGSVIYPPGFSFEADIVFKPPFPDEELKTDMVISPSMFKFDLTLSKPFKIGNIIEISSSNGKSGAEFHMMATQSSASVDIDCRIKFLFLWCDALVKIHPPKLYYIDFKFGLLGLETDFHVETKSDGFYVSFEFGEDHKQKARERTIALVKKAAKKMQQDAEQVKKQSEEAVEAYAKGLKQLEDDLQNAKNQLIEYNNKLKSEFDKQQSDWDSTVSEAKNTIDKLTNDFQNDLDNARNDYNTMINDLNTKKTKLHNDIDLENQTLTDLKTTYAQNVKDTQAHWDSSIANAQTAVDNAQKAEKDAQTNLDTIKKNKPHGRGCSSDDTRNWQNQVNSAQSKLDDCTNKLNDAKTFLQEQHDGKSQQLDEMSKKNEQDEAEIKSNIETISDTISNLESEIQSVENVDIEQFKKLGQLQHSKTMIENNAALQIKQIEDKINTSAQSITLAKCQIDYEHSQSVLEKYEDMKTTEEKSDQEKQNDKREAIKNNINLLIGDDKLWMKFVNEMRDRMIKLIVLIENIIVYYQESKHMLSLPSYLVTMLKNTAYQVSTVGKGDESWFLELETLNRKLVYYESVLIKSNKILENMINQDKYKMIIDSSLITDEDIRTILTTFNNGTAELTHDETNPFSRRLSALTAIEGFVDTCEALLKHSQFLMNDFSFNIESIKDKFTNIGHEIITNVVNKEDYNKLDSVKNFSIEFSEFMTTYNRSFKTVQDRVEEYYESLADTINTNSEFDKSLTSMKNYISQADGTYYHVNKILSDIVHDYTYSAVIVTNSKVGYNLKAYNDAKRNVDECKTALDNAQAAMDAIEKQGNDQIKEISNNSQTQLDSINKQIDDIESGIENDLHKLLKDLIAAETKVEELTNDSNLHIDSIEDNVNNGINSIINAKHNDNVSNSPAGVHVSKCQAKLDAFKSGPLADMAQTASQDAIEAADSAKKAAAIYEHVMRGNSLSFGTIKGSVKWENDDLIFNITVIFDFKLHINLGWFHINIDLGPINLGTLHIDLKEIENIFKNAFKEIWNAIKKAF